MARWNVVISEGTDRTVRNSLARTGGRKDGLSRFVDRAVRQAIFWETVETIQERNRRLSARRLRPSPTKPWPKSVRIVLDTKSRGDVRWSAIPCEARSARSEPFYIG